MATFAAAAAERPLTTEERCDDMSYAIAEWLKNKIKCRVYEKYLPAALALGGRDEVEMVGCDAEEDRPCNITARNTLICRQM